MMKRSEQLLQANLDKFANRRTGSLAALGVVPDDVSELLEDDTPEELEAAPKSKNGQSSGKGKDKEAPSRRAIMHSGEESRTVPEAVPSRGASDGRRGAESEAEERSSRHNGNAHVASETSPEDLPGSTDQASTSSTIDDALRSDDAVEDHARPLDDSHLDVDGRLDVNRRLDDDAESEERPSHSAVIDLTETVGGTQENDDPEPGVSDGLVGRFGKKFGHNGEWIRYGHYIPATTFLRLEEMKVDLAEMTSRRITTETLFRVALAHFPKDVSGWVTLLQRHAEVLGVDGPEVPTRHFLGNRVDKRWPAMMSRAKLQLQQAHGVDVDRRFLFSALLEEIAGLDRATVVDLVDS